ncbi:MAG: aminopeptidase P family protein [Rhodospirillaceae bacterium]|nr:aminopeptidase P family protein [Rhodospirillaceae bacterium]
MNEVPKPLQRVSAAAVPAARLAALRTALAAAGLDGFLVPRSDEHQGEYVPPAAERLAFLTGFTGSAGLAIVLSARAAVFVDGRYTLQAEAEIDAGQFEICHLARIQPPEWLAGAAGAGQRIGYDPWLHTPLGLASPEAAATKAGATLVAAANAVDAIWSDRPAPPTAPVVPLPLEFAGKASVEKRADIAKSLMREGVAAAVLTLPDSIAWLLNVRGGDVAHSPLPLSFAILHADGAVDWFLDPRKVSPLLEASLDAGVRLAPPENFAGALAALGGKKVQADPATAAIWIFNRLGEAGATILRAADPCLMPKACKNSVELDGMRAAHLRDGAALTRFLAWVATEAPKGGVREMAAADRLERFRQHSNLLRDLSFPTISGAGPNGAIVHYRATPKSDRALAPGELYLVDSGGQYPDGTTDVTRTVAIGTPTPAMRRHFTLVLKGHIALATARFPAGTSGSQLDALARLALWRDGLDYDHGTGHGVGHYLCVHEGPQRISKLPNTVALKPGMIVSNEPGYYKAGAYGIRIENLVAVTKLGETETGADLLGFETLTVAPIDRALIDPALLTADEAAWIDAYHARVRSEVGPQLEGADRAWLDQATAPLAP